MVQNTIKILTLGFFISMITGFVLYRSGFFDSSESTSHLQTSPNGGELLANVDQDTNRSQQINQANEETIMPSSKSLAPVFDFDELSPEFKREIMSSSKSILHPIEIKPSPDAVTESNRQAIKIQPEMVPADTPTVESKTDKSTSNKLISNQIDVGDEPKKENEQQKGIDWRVIGLGVLGICFVGIGAIVYFKRKSK